MGRELQNLNPGDRIVVRTPDRREYYGRLLEVRPAPANDQAVVRLDTGWVTAYPLDMVHPVDRQGEVPQSGSS